LKFGVSVFSSCQAISWGGGAGSGWSRLALLFERQGEVLLHGREGVGDHGVRDAVILDCATQASAGHHRDVKAGGRTIEKANIHAGVTDLRDQHLARCGVWGREAR
jgi:hypothetical protein